MQAVAVVALAVGWQMAELASLLADAKAPLEARRALVAGLVRTVGHRVRQLGLRTSSGVEVDTGPLSRQLSPVDPGDTDGAAGRGKGDGERSGALRAVLALHADILDGLGRLGGTESAAELRKAYELGRALAQTSFVAALAEQNGQPSLYRRLFDPSRLVTLAEWLASLRLVLPEDAADAVFYSLRCWCGWVAAAGDGDLSAAGPALREQSRIWKDLLFARRPAASLVGRPGELDGEDPLPGELRTISLAAAFAGGGAQRLSTPEQVRVVRAGTVLPPRSSEPVAPSEQPRRGRRPRRWGATLLTWILVAGLALGVTLTLRAYVVQPFSIPSASMVPTLEVGDRILVDKLPGALAGIHVGDIIVFHRVPRDTAPPETTDLVKRVIALPGQTVSSHGDEVLVNGRPLAEPWLPRLVGECSQTSLDILPQRIPPNEYFVLGDCRGISYDSRFWGPVPRANIIGKVFLVLWRHNHPWFHWF